MPEGGRRIVVGRLRKPHGLKGDVTCFPLTDRPDELFRAGRRLMVVDLAGELVGEGVTIERGRSYHREWLLKFEGIDHRDQLGPLRAGFLAVEEAELPPLADGEVYMGDLAGFAVRDAAGTPLGLVTAAYELPAGLTIEVQGPKREFLLPFRKEFVVEMDARARTLVVAPPPGLVDEGG
ncbi:MAG: ribosome maturation factor RimM [Gemmatimonadales bacterium]|nr:ribosome maturation factor RimM [Gemmatimonadales bacterium]